MLQFLRGVAQKELKSARLSEAVISRVEIETQAVLYFFFEGSERSPSLVVKVSSDPHKNGGLRREYENLLKVGECLPESLGASVPRVLGSGQWRGHFYYVQNFISGRMLGSAIRSRPFGAQRMSALPEIGRAWEWLMRFQAATSAEVRAIDDFGFRALLDTYAACHASTARERELVGELAAALERSGGAKAPVSACHGDLFSGNILLGRDGVAVIDWRYFRSAYHPCFDAMTFVATLSPSPARGARSNVENDFQKLLFEKHWTNGFFRSLFGTFLAKRGIDSDLFSLLCAMTLVEMSVREYSATGVAGEKDELWRRRLMCFLENRERMIIRPGPMKETMPRSGR